MAGVSPRDALVRRVDPLRAAKTTHVPRLLPALPLFRAVAARPACLLHAQPEIRLTRAPVLHLVLRDRLCRLVDRAYPRDRDPLLPDLSLEPAPACLPHAPQRESVAEHSLDSRFCFFSPGRPCYAPPSIRAALCVGRL